MPLFRILGLLSLAVLLNACKDIDDPTPPTPTIVTADCDTYVCTFEGTGVNGDADGELGFEWNFGDGRTGIGRKIEHIYLESGNYTVTLGAVDRLSNSSTVTKEITVTGATKATPFHYLVREIISDLLYTVDIHKATQTQIPSLVSRIENELSASNLPAEIQCAAAGSAEISDWDDDGNLSIDTSETITLSMDGCQFDASQPALHTTGTVSLTDINNTGNYSLNSINVVPGFRLDNYPTKSVSGSFAYNKNESTAGTYDLTSPDFIRFLRFSTSTGEVILESRFTAPMFSFTHDLSYLNGQAKYEGSTTGEWKMKIIQPLSFNESAETATLAAGAFAIAQDTSTTIITISVDADPAYLLVSIENDEDAAPDIVARLEQRLVTLRANQFDY